MNNSPAATKSYNEVDIQPRVKYRYRILVLTNGGKCLNARPLGNASGPAPSASVWSDLSSSTPSMGAYDGAMKHTSMRRVRPASMSVYPNTPCTFVESFKAC